VPRKRVFISYSRKDERYLAALQEHLKPYADRLLVDPWSDARLRASQDVDAEIRAVIEASSVAVLLVSPAFLASDYVREKELPVLLRAREEGRIRLACLYVKPSAVDDLEFEVSLAEGPRSVKLTRYQGLNGPRDPVANRRGARRDELLADVARQVRSLVDARAEAAPEPPAGSGRRSPVAEPSGGEAASEAPRLRSSVVRHTADERRYGLGVRIALARGQIYRTYRHTDGTTNEFRSPWEPLRAELAAWEVHGRAALDDQAFRDALYRALFGPADEHRSAVLMRTVFRTTSGIEPRPILHPVRVRIQAEDPPFRDLPWAYSAWNDHALADAGWTFELVGELPVDAGHELPNVQLRTPCPCLVVSCSADAADGDRGERHFRAFEELLARVWPHYRGAPQHATDRGALEEALRRRRPRIVYFYGPADATGSEIRLRLGDGDEGVSLGELAATWRHAPPEVLFLNLVGELRDASGALAALSPAVPLVVAHYAASEEAAEARTRALGWFQSLLEGDERADPVALLQDRALPGAVAWVGYDNWTTRTTDASPRPKLARLLLDRKPQRARARNAVDELMRERGRRLCCLIAYGEPGNHLELFWDQILEHLQRNAADVAHVVHLRLELADGPSFDLGALDRRLREVLRLEPGEPVMGALMQRRPRAPGPARPLLLLDWGIRGEDRGGPISTRALETWLELCNDRLASQTPEELRLLSCLALERPADRHEAIASAVDRLRGQPRFRNRAFRIELLPPIGRVTSNDLADFLDGHGNSSCPDDLIPAIPELMLRATGGRFAPTVELIETAEKTSWYELYDRLRDETEHAHEPSPTLEEEIL